MGPLMTNLAEIKAELAAGRERLLAAIGGVTEEQMNDGVLADMMAELDAELARAEASLPEHPEQTRQTEVMRALALGLGNFERMRAHDVHLLAARLSPRRG